MTDAVPPANPESNELELLRARYAELELQLRQQQQIIDSLPMSIVWKDRDGHILGCNQPLANAAALAVPADLIGKTDSDIAWATLAPIYRSNDQAIFASGKPRPKAIEELEQADGTLIWLETNKLPLRDDQGQIFAILSTVEDITARRQAEDERLERQEMIIAGQASVLAELSTPLIPLRDGVLLMPLVGAIDTRRTQQVLEALLEGISAYQAETAIMDITGVKVMDTQVADGLLRAARAAKLLGATVYLSGISAEIAQTLVQLGTDLDQIITFGSLQAAIARAFR
jgi:rsbT co-antagonist protein RsbR